MDDAEQRRLEEEYAKKKEAQRLRRKEGAKKAVETKRAAGQTFRKIEGLPEDPEERKKALVKRSQENRKEKTKRFIEAGILSKKEKMSGAEVSSSLLAAGGGAVLVPVVEIEGFKPAGKGGAYRTQEEKDTGKKLAAMKKNVKQKLMRAEAKKKREEAKEPPKPRGPKPKYKTEEERLEARRIQSKAAQERRKQREAEKKKTEPKE